LRNGMLELAVMLQPAGEQIAGIEFESLRTDPYYVALTAAHPFARLKSIPVEMVATEPLIGLSRRDFPEYYRNLNRIFAPTGVKPHIALECDSRNSLIIEVEARHGIALCPVASGNRLLYRPLTGPTDPLPVGIARATKGDLTPGGEKFREVLRKTSAARATSESR
jgi:DNA-binding transcriptional LysR family regulator